MVLKNIQAIRGMNDCLPSETPVWQYIESALKRVLTSYCYREIRFPLIEQTLLFKRAVGGVTDLVEKEMYTFEDRSGNSLTLRPEGTAGCVRACIENGLYSQEQRLWYLGPMFRYERPQKGRYRQFNQLGVEVFGLQGPDIDAELIMLAVRFWRTLGITKYISLQVNSIGSLKVRANYCKALIVFLENNKQKLDEDCRRRMYSNPLRVLDSKNPNMQKLFNDAPVLGDYLDEKSSEHFSNLCSLLETVGIEYTINQRLVRGLDYYNHTIFEWVTTHLGTQRTICAGGRYDTLVKELGGHSTPAIGFAVGLERLVLLVKKVNPKFKTNSIVDIYLITFSIHTQTAAFKLVEQIRDRLPSINIMTNHGGGNIKKQFVRANKWGARAVLVLGTSEIINNNVIIKDLLSGSQAIVMQNHIVTHLRSIFGIK